MLKRAFDIAVSTTALTVLAPVMAAIAVAIRLDSPGTVFYRGIRTGRNGDRFHMLKFRTMRAGSEKQPEGTTGKSDPRITRIGHRLRKFKLDELPQLINVLKGEMSLVGPRPELPRYTDQYQAEEKLILTVRPGITDYSSIVFSSLDEVVGATDVDRNFETYVLPRKNQLRIKYVKEQSFLVDLKILAMTAGAIVRKAWPGRGSKPPLIAQTPTDQPVG